MTCLNAPYGAWCFLTFCPTQSNTLLSACLNAPYGAWCFLTTGWQQVKGKWYFLES